MLKKIQRLMMPRVLPMNKGDFETSETVRKRIIFTGKVQNVGFRYTVAQTAQQLDLTGWAKNLLDGRVEVEIQGETLHIDALVNSLYQIKRFTIEHIESHPLALVECETHFEIIY